MCGVSQRFSVLPALSSRSSHLEDLWLVSSLLASVSSVFCAVTSRDSVFIGEGLIGGGASVSHSLGVVWRIEISHLSSFQLIVPVQSISSSS